MWAFLAGFLNVLLLLVGLFLIILILIQRGRGGGLAGAFGGLGGSSPFGSRAGTTIMWVTVWGSFLWFLLVMLQVIAIQNAARHLPVS